jgi:hypothetical protein
MVDGEDQSEVWASFRMGRRARVVEISEGPGWVEGVHDGYKRLGVMHRRRIELGERGLIVRDWIEGRGRHKVKVHWHLAPGVAGDAVELDGKLRRRDKAGWWCEGFGKRVERKVVVGEWEGEGPVEVVSRISGGSDANTLLR